LWHNGRPLTGNWKLDRQNISYNFFVFILYIRYYKNTKIWQNYFSLNLVDSFIYHFNLLRTPTEITCRPLIWRFMYIVVWYYNLHVWDIKNYIVSKRLYSFLDTCTPQTNCDRILNFIRIFIMPTLKNHVYNCR